MHSTIRFIGIYLAPVLLASACGQPVQQVEIKNSQLASSDDPNCKPGNCDPVEYSVLDGSGKSLDSASQSGVVGQEFVWSVKVKSSVPAPRIKVAVLEKLGWMKVRSLQNEGGGQEIYGTPTESVSQNAVIILARDIARCAAMEKVPKDCSDSKKSLKEYDRTFQMKYSISGGNNSNVPPPNAVPPNNTPEGVSLPGNGTSSPLCSGFIGNIVQIFSKDSCKNQ